MADNPIGRSRFIGSGDWGTLVLRGLASLLIVLGLYQWVVIIGVATPSAGTPFSDLPGAPQAAIINLAVAFPVAATGLWLLARWGVVIWLYGAFWQIAMHTLFAGTFGFQLVPIAIQLAMVGAYGATLVFQRRTLHNRGQGDRVPRDVRTADHPKGRERLSARARAGIAATLARRPRRDVEKPPEEAIPPAA